MEGSIAANGDSAVIDWLGGKGDIRVNDRAGVGDFDAATVSLMRSTDGGSTWDAMSDDSPFEFTANAAPKGFESNSCKLLIRTADGGGSLDVDWTLTGRARWAAT